MKVSNLPDTLQFFAFQRMQEQTNRDLDKMKTLDIELKDFIDFENTPEGSDYWNGVNEGTITELPNENNSNYKKFN